MNNREIDRLEKNSIYTIKVNQDMREKVINKYLNDLSREIKTNVKKRELIIMVMSTK